MTPLITTSKFSFAYANFEVGIQPTGAAKKENVLALHCDSDPDPRKLTCYCFFAFACMKTWTTLKTQVQHKD